MFDENMRSENVAPGLMGAKGGSGRRKLSTRQVLASIDNLAQERVSARNELAKMQKLQPAAPKKHTFKILIVGNSKCGKTSIIDRYANDNFTGEYNITIGADYTRKVVEWADDSELRLQLWDIAGQDRFAMMTRPYYRNAHAAVVVCDVTRPLTIDAVRDWKLEIDEKMGDERLPCILLANKCDMLKGVSEALEIGARIESICSELGFNKWFISSAKNDENITDGMNFLLGELVKGTPAKAPKPTDSFKLGNPGAPLGATHKVPLVLTAPLDVRRKPVPKKKEEGECIIL